MSELVSEKLAKDPRIAEAKKLILEALQEHTSQLEIESAVKIRTTSRRSTFAATRVSPEELTELPQESSRTMVLIRLTLD